MHLTETQGSQEMNSEYERLQFSYSLDVPKSIKLKGKLLTNPNIIARQIRIMPSAQGAKKYWLVIAVSHADDQKYVGEILIDVKPDSAIHHETFVTVESGIRSGILGTQRAEAKTKLERDDVRILNDVRQRLLDDWLEVLKDSKPSDELVLKVASDLVNSRTLLRVDARDRLFKTIGFLDSLGRHNPRANAARLTAAIARLRMQVEADVFTRKSLYYRYLNCTVLAENIAADIWDMQVMAELGRPSYIGTEFAKRLKRMAIKPYFWAVLWIKHNISMRPMALAYNAPFVAQLLATEQRLGEIDILLSEYKRADNKAKKKLLQLVTLSIASFPTDSMPLDYLNLFANLRTKLPRLAITKSKTDKQYNITASAMQSLIRYRESDDPENAWHNPHISL